MRVGRRIADQLLLTGHRDRVGDIGLLAELGVNAVRYPALWEHVAPRGLAAADWSWPDRRLLELRRRGMRPVVGLLHHGHGPRGMSLLHPGFPAAFARYAAAAAQRYPWVDTWLPINEPLTTARFSGLYGWWHPHARSEPIFALMLLAQCQAVRLAGRAIRRANPAARVLVNEDVGWTFSTPPLSEPADHLNQRRWLTWDLLEGRVTPEHPLHGLLASTPASRRLLAALADDPEPPDLLGVDHYLTSDRFLDHRLAMYPEWAGETPYVDVEACRMPGLPAAGLRRAIAETWQRYRRPIVLAEVALAGEPADQVHWWNDAWQAALDAQAAGADVRAVTAWAAFGGVDWHCLMREAAGLYAPGLYDASVDPPRRLPVAAAVRATARDRLAACHGPKRRSAPARVAPGGWWVRPDRFTFPPFRAVDRR